MVFLAYKNLPGNLAVQLSLFNVEQIFILFCNLSYIFSIYILLIQCMIFSASLFRWLKAKMLWPQYKLFIILSQKTCWSKKDTEYSTTSFALMFFSPLMSHFSKTHNKVIKIWKVELLMSLSQHDRVFFFSIYQRTTLFFSFFSMVQFLKASNHKNVGSKQRKGMKCLAQPEWKAIEKSLPRRQSKAAFFDHAFFLSIQPVEL